MGGEQNFKSSWEQDIYWNHFQFNHFVQFLTKDYHQRLALPQTFSQNVKKKLPQDVSLKGPSGAVWNIMLTTRDGIVYFADGWQQFVKDHTLKENDFLVFKYNGESVFEVLVFDGESLCEKATSYFVGKCKGCCGKEKDTNNSNEEINNISNAAVECGSPEKLVHLNNRAEPSKTTKGKTSNDRVESCPEEFMADAVAKIGTQKKRGRPPKVSNFFDEEFAKRKMLRTNFFKVEAGFKL